MNHITFVVNPVAAKGAARRIPQMLERLLIGKEISYDILLTSGPGNATELARSATGQVVVAVGGDGTINEVVNGMLESGKVLGVIPAGSGNDLVKSVDIPLALPAAIDAVIAGRTKVIDVGTVECWSEDSGSRSDGRPGPRYFVNGVGVGFDAAVAVRVSRIKFLRGIALYLLAVFQTLGKYESPRFQLSIDSRPQESRNLLMAIGNGRCAGGGFYLTPDARVDDGMLDVCIIRHIPVFRILQLLPRAMNGKHKGAKEATFLKAKKISIASDSKFYVHADGEIAGNQVDHVELGIREQALQVLVR